MDEGVVTMVVTQGMFIIGKLVGGNKLIGPRLFSVIEDGKRIMMSPLPGTPPFIIIGDTAIRYPYPEADKSAMELYWKVTHPEEQTRILTGKGGNA